MCPKLLPLATTDLTTHMPCKLNMLLNHDNMHHFCVSATQKFEVSPTRSHPLPTITSSDGTQHSTESAAEEALPSQQKMLEQLRLSQSSAKDWAYEATGSQSSGEGQFYPITPTAYASSNIQRAVHQPAHVDRPLVTGAFRSSLDNDSHRYGHSTGQFLSTLGLIYIIYDTV